MTRSAASPPAAAPGRACRPGPIPEATGAATPAAAPGPTDATPEATGDAIAAAASADSRG